MKKSYVIDTNVIINNTHCLDILRNGEENEVYVPFHVLMELDNLKKNPKVGHLAREAIKAIQTSQHVKILKNQSSKSKWTHNVDTKILEEIKSSDIVDPVLVTSDIMLQILAKDDNIQSEDFKDSIPFRSASEKYTGFVEDGEEMVPNSFQWDGDGVVMNKCGTRLPIYHINTPWKTRPRNVYQNLAMQLILDSTIDVVTIQSPPGRGKSHIALASAFYLTYELKQYEKIYVIKNNVEIGTSLGFLPGSVEEKMAPYATAINYIVKKLDKIRAVSKLFSGNGNGTLSYNEDKFQIMPLNYLRGINIENGFVLLEETQNLSRQEGRAVLSRLGDGCKVVCIGDTNQVDNKFLNSHDNLLNWMVKLFKGNVNYGHITLEGEETRGPICDMVIKSGL